MKVATHHSPFGRLTKIIVLVSVLAAVAADTADQTKGSYQESFINPYPRFKLYNDGGDPGEPLFLTPLIHDPKIPKADVQEKARVVGSQFLDVESYAGYLTVDENYNSNLFFWYFPAENDPTDAPTVLWLQGGPGASSLFGLFMENGPFQLQSNGDVRKRDYSWSKTHNLIYIDNPVGTGFSFTDHDEGYSKNEKDVGRNLHEAMQQLYELFAWNSTYGFWVTGESYAGKYVPALAFHIHKVQSSIDTRVHIPLRGLAIGNGLSDPLHQLKYGDYLYQVGLIDEHGLETFHNAEAKGAKCIKDNDMKCAFNVFDSLINGDLSKGSIFHNITGYEFYFNYLKTKDDDNGSVLGKFLQSSETRRAIHVGNKTFHDLDTENKVEQHLITDVMASVSEWIAELLEHYKICIYNGQLDIIVAYPLTRNYLQKLKFRGANVYKVAPRKIWKVENEIAGYVKYADKLVEIMIRNAGHMAPMDQPKWSFWMIDHLTHNKTLV